MPEYLISNHAREQMKLRNVPIDVVMNVLTNPQQILTNVGKSVYQSIINFNDGNYLVRVIVNNLKEPNKVITVYRTSKIDKYYEG